jgi:ABC-2 type transport system permease protein
MVNVTALRLLRDRGALAMAFLLPPAIFVVFATIFQGTSGDQMRLSVSFGMSAATETNRRLEEALRAVPSLRFQPDSLSDEAAVAAQVQEGTADAGLFVRGDIAGDVDGPIVVLVDRGKLTAGAILTGRLQEAVATAMPDVGLARTAPLVEHIVGGFTPEQAARLASGIEAMANDPPDATEGGAMVATETLGPAAGPGGIVTYYVGAVAILFLLFSAMQSSATLIEERDSGIMDRLAVARSATDAVVVGRYLFLLFQGFAQTTLIFAVAALVYGVDVLANIGLWALATLSAAGAAAGLGLAVAAVCSTKQQAQTVTTFVVLLCSAVGGSMVPRFMMPAWLQDVGWYTPNAWAIEAYDGVIWRGETLAQIMPSLALLVLMAVLGLATAMVASRLRLRG